MPHHHRGHRHHADDDDDDDDGNTEPLGGSSPLGEPVPGFSNFSMHPYWCMPPGNNLGIGNDGMTVNMMLQICTGSCAGFTFPSTDGKVHADRACAHARSCKRLSHEPCPAPSHLVLQTTYRDVAMYGKRSCTILPEYTNCDDVLINNTVYPKDQLIANGVHWCGAAGPRVAKRGAPLHWPGRA